jgi:hypothetical protein
MRPADRRTEQGIRTVTGKTFMNAVANGRRDILQVFLDVLAETRTAYCVIGGIAVNAYAEPLVSLDLDVVVIADKVAEVARAAEAKRLRVERFAHSVNLTSPESDLRIQLQTDERYQAFLDRSARKLILGYEMIVAAVEDVLQGKIWAYSDRQRRLSKRQKDLADIARLVEAYPALEAELTPDIREKLL